ncbi:hypothetical protein BTE77_35560 [Ensifer adhaerens]|nr:hypothetical protein BTE77_35560 [Ensifer adhaerens]
MIENIAYVIERERVKKRMTKTEQAAALNLSIGTYFLICRHASNPSINLVTDIARRLGVSTHELLFGKQLDAR